MEKGERLHSGAVEMLNGGHSDVVENAEAARQSEVTALRNRSVQVLEAFQRTEAYQCWRGYDCWAVRLVSLPANGYVRTIGRPRYNISDSIRIVITRQFLYTYQIAQTLEIIFSMNSFSQNYFLSNHISSFLSCTYNIFYILILSPCFLSGFVHFSLKFFKDSLSSDGTKMAWLHL